MGKTALLILNLEIFFKNYYAAGDRKRIVADQLSRSYLD
jgi:hypothetical protein